MASENPRGGDNQQETDSKRPLHPDWVCGFVDGEGCFSVSIHANPYVRRTRGWQLYPTFQVSQHCDNRDILEALVPFFGAGRVRDKGPKSSVLVYGVWGARKIAQSIIPFFESHPLRVKQQDFERFSAIVSGLLRKEHLTDAGFERLVRLAYSMNGRGRQRTRTLEAVLKGSSETVREARATYDAKVGVMIQSEPYGDMRSQAEMTWPLSVRNRTVVTNPA